MQKTTTIRPTPARYGIQTTSLFDREGSSFGEDALVKTLDGLKAAIPHKEVLVGHPFLKSAASPIGSNR